MVDQNDKKNPRRPRRPARKRAPSKISQAQDAAVKVRKERDSLRAQSVAETAKRTSGKIVPGKPTAAQPGLPSKTYPESKGYSSTPDRTKTSGPGDSKPIQDPLLAGLSTGLGTSDPGVAKTVTDRKRELANPALYGNADKTRTDKLDAYKRAIDDTKRRLLSKNDNAVYMGPGNVTYRNRGPQRINEDGSTTTKMQSGDDIQSKDELMSWLSDPLKVEQIKKVAQQAGLNVQTYDDISKLWESVVSMAASTYSRTQKKVTPWALIAMRGKYAGPDGRMKDQVSTSTTVEELDPATAKGLIRDSAANFLGRDPTKAELEDFVAKAQTIAAANPNITTTRTKTGFDGAVEIGNSTSTSTGGRDVVAAQAKEAAMAQAKGSEDYSSYQAAGVYMPWLMDALASPI